MTIQNSKEATGGAHIYVVKKIRIEDDGDGSGGCNDIKAALYGIRQKGNREECD